MTEAEVGALSGQRVGRAGRGRGPSAWAADTGRQRVRFDETNFATSRLVFFPPFSSMEMTLVLVRNQISF